MTVSISDSLENAISEEDRSLAPESSEAALLRLADFVRQRSGGKSKTRIAQVLKTQKIISIYEQKMEAPWLQQKGLQLDKAA